MISYIIGFCIGIAIYHTVKYIRKRVLLYCKSKKVTQQSTLLELMNRAVHELNLVEKVKDPKSVISNSTWEQIYKWFKKKIGRKPTPMLTVALYVIARDLNSEDGLDSKIGIRTRKAINEWFERDFIDPITLQMICDDFGM